MRSKKKHAYVIFSRDRPSMLRATIRSLLNDGVEAKEIIVSDSSSRNKGEVKGITRDYNVKRLDQSGLSICMHYERIITGGIADYVTIIHDDDIVMKGFKEEVERMICMFPQASALAVNGVLFSEEGAWIRPFGLSFIPCNRYTVHKSSSEVLRSWVSPLSHGIAPFSGYTFRCDQVGVQNFKIADEALHYYDTILIALMCDKSNVVWSSLPLLGIRHHQSSTTNLCTQEDLNSFVMNAKATFEHSDIDEVLETYYMYHQRSNDYFVGKRLEFALHEWRRLLKVFKYLCMTEGGILKYINNKALKRVRL